MKSIVIIAFVCCLVVANALILREKCETNADCGEGECCVKTHDYTSNLCKKLRQKDEFCFPNKEWNDLGDTYKFMCPCVEGFECHAAKVTEEDGITKYENARCVASS